MIPKNIDDMTMLVIPPHPDQWGHTNDEGTARQTRPSHPDSTRGILSARWPLSVPELSADLNETEIARVAEYAAQLRGYTSLIEVRGYCNKRPVDGTEFLDHMDLSIQRARTVATLLIANGINPQRINIVGAGTTQPITRSNRRRRPAPQERRRRIDPDRSDHHRIPALISES